MWSLMATMRAMSSSDSLSNIRCSAGFLTTSPSFSNAATLAFTLTHHINEAAKHVVDHVRMFARHTISHSTMHTYSGHSRPL